MTSRLIARSLLLSLSLAGLTGMTAAPAIAAQPDCPKYPTKYNVGGESQSVTRTSNVNGARRYTVTMTVNVRRGPNGGRPCGGRGPAFHTGGHADYLDARTNASGAASYTLTKVGKSFSWYMTYDGSSTAHHIFDPAKYRTMKVGETRS